MNRDARLARLFVGGIGGAAIVGIALVGLMNPEGLQAAFPSLMGLTTLLKGLGIAVGVVLSCFVTLKALSALQRRSPHERSVRAVEEAWKGRAPAGLDVHVTAIYLARAPNGPSVYVFLGGEEAAALQERQRLDADPALTPALLAWLTPLEEELQQRIPGAAVIVDAQSALDRMRTFPMYRM